MIRINLLESITDKPTSPAIVIEKKVSNPSSRFYLLAGVIGGILVLGMAFDYLWASSTLAAAKTELTKQQQIAKEMEAILAEQAELDKKIKDMDDRITAIKNLRGTQSGPSAVLQALSERIGNTPGLYLESVEQKGEKLIVKGNSPNEYTVSGFGRSLEFSSGLFSNLSISLERKEIAATQVNSEGGVVSSGDANSKKPETVNFTINCDYTPSKAAEQSPLPNGQPNDATATKTQTANNNQPAAGNGTNQISKN